MATQISNVSNTVKNYGNTYASAYTFRREVILNSQDTLNNKSNVTVKLYGKGNGSFTFTQSSGLTASIIVDSVTKITSAVTSMNLTEKLLTSWTGDISHDADGTKTANILGKFTNSLTASYLPISNDTGGNVTLTEIPRQSTFGALDSEYIIDDYFGTPLYFQIPIVKNIDTYTDDLGIYVEDTLIKTVSNFEDGDNLTFTTDELEEIYLLNQNTLSFAMYFVLETYSGTTLIGSSTSNTTSAVITTREPSISINISEGDSVVSATGYCLPNVSIAVVTLNDPATVYKDAISDETVYQVYIGGELVNQYVGTDEFPLVFEKQIANSNQIQVKVIDSRGSINIRNIEASGFYLPNYTVPSVAISKVERNEEDSTQVDLSLYVSINHMETINEQITNELTNLFYYYSTDQENWTAINLTSLIEDDSQTDYVLNDINVGSNFDEETTYYFKATAWDRGTSTTSSIKSVATIKPTAWLETSEKLIGVGGKPTSGLPSGSVDVQGGYYMQGTELLSTIFNTQLDSDSGYIDLGNSLILQWGVASGTGQKSFNKEFPNACMTVIATPNWASTSNPAYVTISAIGGFDKTGFMLGSFGYMNVGSYLESTTTQSYRAMTPSANFGGGTRWFSIGY